MSVYILKIKPDLPKTRFAALGNNFCCFTKVVNASSVEIARAMAAEDARLMGEFDNPKAWISNTLSSCKKVTPDTDSGVIANEYAH